MEVPVAWRALALEAPLDQQRRRGGWIVGLFLFFVRYLVGVGGRTRDGDGLARV
jgi:hypothetical protein